MNSNDGGPAVNLQAAVGEINRLKAKMTAMEQEKAAEREADTDTFKDAALQWYTNLPRNSIASYVDFHKKFIHQFAETKHVQVTTTSLFGIRHGHNESLLEYLARFSEATIQVSNPNQEIFVAAVQNDLKAGHFNESLAQKPVSTMQEVMKMAECYIKGEESNAEKKNRDSREQPSSRRSPERYHRRMHVLDEILSAGLARLPPAPDNNIRMSPNENLAKGSLTKRSPPRSPRRSPPREDEEKETKRIAVNTITGGFAGGGESRAAIKRYLRRIVQETNIVVQVSSPRAPEISFSPNDGEGVFPHNDDPLAFKDMQLAGEQLKPYNETPVGFAGEQVEVMGHVTLLTTFGEKDSAKTIKEIRGEAEIIKKIQHQNSGKGVPRRRLSAETPDGTKQGRKASPQLGRPLQNSRSIWRMSLQVGNTEGRDAT
ncbi:hypothetical protein TSUD_143780 [Trifolium subterraneum]|uniref:Retrotransposon gag domain-containing protein n=1 Tax=Trifolium subterraneum TaxID=3900 RepID=A0A2Z6N4A2_TRISU|nr:hypothetical protein TSUD_143780 [Trifolium subterraneum]